MTRLYLLCVLIICYGCTSGTPSAQEVVDKAIVASGGEVVANSSIHFKFRKYYYRATREDGLRTLERCTDEECQVQQDIIKDNGEFVRFRKSVKEKLPDSMKGAYASSVNSVHYFSVLPYGLNDPAVRKTYVGQTTIKGDPYHQIKVTFKQEGGGKDFEDEYVYWIHKETYKVNYLAYNYQVNEGGTRFRAAYNERTIEGIRFVDYDNYVPKGQFPRLETLGALYENNQLDLLSKIELEDVTVEVCPAC